ncbi:MAG: hypothetical protein Q9216_006478 [Gyalolechia sp. 2 TL-2023]
MQELNAEFEDANPLQFSRSLLEKAERDFLMHAPPPPPPTEPSSLLHESSSSGKRGKRPFTAAGIDPGYANKRAKTGGGGMMMMNGPTSAEIRFIEGKPYIPLEEFGYGDGDGDFDGVGVEEKQEEEEEDDDDDDEESGGAEEDKVDEDESEDAPQPTSQLDSGNGKHNLLSTRDSPILGSGSLIPPEIVRFDANEEKPLESHIATEEKTREAMKEDMKIETQFWPGDPVFLFGETKFLQAVKSRQIEKDLAPNDATVRSEIDRRPLYGMFARFELPRVSKSDEEKPSK